MRLWFRYFREKKVELFLYFTTVLLFVAVGSLSHIENLEKLLYAALLTFVVWGAVGFWQGIKYVRRSRRLEEAALYFEQSGELLVELWDTTAAISEDGVEDAETLADAYCLFVSMICDSQTVQRLKWQERSAERRDYYMTWTHQIKTPISAMKLLLDGQEFHSREGFLMREELFKIEQYAEMVLTFQRLESISSDMVLQEYDLHSLVKQAVRKYSVLFINKGLKLDLQDMQINILTDEKWFVFCLEQLLSNSIKYTSKGGISIGAEASEDKAILCIEDTGIGICPEDLPRIFEKGFTGYNGRLDKKSTGIGLYLCRQIFTHLGITVRVESEEEKGTKVTLGLQCAGKLLT